MTQEAHKTPSQVKADLSKNLTCPITHELFVEPVLAEDGNTYERGAIIQWLETNKKSPLDPSKELSASRLVPARVVLNTIEVLVQAGLVEDDLIDLWNEKKKKNDLTLAQKLFQEGRVLEAAKLGLTKAQGEVAINYYEGQNGFPKDLEKSLKFAEKAAIGGDRSGQFRLGFAFDEGEGRPKDWKSATWWYSLAAKQGVCSARLNLGLIYKKGGHGIPKDLRKSFACFRESAESSNDSQVQYNLAKCYFYGHGVAQDLASARHWFQKSADQNQPQSMYNLGSMMMKGEGGEWLVKEGGLLVVASASAGCVNAKSLLGEVERRSAHVPPSDIDKDLGVSVGLLLELI